MSSLSKPSYRREQVAQVLSAALTKIIDEKRGFMGLPLITINYIKLSADLKHSRIYFSFYEPHSPRDNYETWVEETLNQYCSGLRRELAKLVYLKSLPELHFHYDELLQQGNKIIELINRG